MLLLTLLVLAVLSVIGFVAPLWLARNEEKPALGGLAYFARDRPRLPVAGDPS